MNIVNFLNEAITASIFRVKSPPVHPGKIESIMAFLRLTRRKADAA